VECEKTAPTDVAAGREDFHELALVIEQADEAFRQNERATEVIHDRGNDGAGENGGDDYYGDGVVHGFLLSVFGSSPEQETAVRQRENCTEAILTKRPSGCACARISLLRTLGVGV